MGNMQREIQSATIMEHNQDIILGSSRFHFQNCIDL